VVGSVAFHFNLLGVQYCFHW